MRAVKLDKHTGFADENDMYSYFVSAKSGDNVASAFHRIAADWAGVVLTKPEMEIAAVRSPLPSRRDRALAGAQPLGAWCAEAGGGEHCQPREGRRAAGGGPDRHGGGRLHRAMTEAGGIWSAQVCAMCRAVGAAAAASGLG